MAGKRKTPQSWIDAGLKALQKNGPDGLRAETLAREMGTTKGSFYWHFKDVPAFHDAVLSTWSERAADRFDTTLARGDTVVTQLRALAAAKPDALEQAVRAWGVHNKSAGRAIAAEDSRRLAAIGALLTDLDATHPDFPGLIHAALISAPKGGNHAETLIDLLLVLK